ncbi:MAG: phenylalanine--tRNA ligase subunit beta [Coriobacteriales bacterium]|jgi:phenylalanyl-tRNA synthetase beta chain
MRVSYEWLKTMVDVPQDARDLVEQYTRTGTEVEALDTVGQALDNVVTSKIVSKQPHPDSDHLWVTMVDVGDRNLGADGRPAPLQVVCGAQNFEVGDHTVTALPGAELPGGVRIEKSRLRGVTSFGMNCSARELGLGSDHSGIMILPADAPVGVPASQYLGLSDVVIDCEITPNRPDCLSMVGMARETGAILDEDVRFDLPKVQREQGTPAQDSVSVTIEDPELCQRYVARVVRGVKIGPSPEWLARRVMAAGSRPINNVVDVTNYVMYLTGQPLHAFDLGKLSHDERGRAHIVVRAAREGEQIETLDGKTRALTPDMAVITDDGKTPVALAGVMGGMNSEIDEGTVDVLLEAAAFSSGHISRTSRNLQLMSEASMRYERVVDRAGCRDVADVACALFEQCCGATVAPGCVDEYPVPLELPRLTLRCERLRQMMGAPITDGFAAHSLERLGCSVTPGDQPHVFDVIPPSYRPDLPREVDLYEEVVRLWGEGDIEPTIPAARNHLGGLTTEQRRLRLAGATLRASGLNETINYNFVPEDDLARARMDGLEGMGIPVRLMSPMSSDMAVMRRSMIPGLLRNVAFNQAHGVGDVALYEVGRLYFGRPGKAQPKERTYVSGVLAGSWSDQTWYERPRQLDFFDAKGAVENLLDALRIVKARFEPADPADAPFAQPGRVATVMASGRRLGWVAELHPQVVAAFDAEGAVAAFELDLEALIALSASELPYRDVPQLPSVDMDLALVVDESVSYERLMQAITSAGGKSLDSVRLFDVYRDPVHVGPHSKSMTFALKYRAADRTLTSQEAEALHERLVKKVCAATGAKVRGE